MLFPLLRAWLICTLCSAFSEPVDWFLLSMAQGAWLEHHDTLAEAHLQQVRKMTQWFLLTLFHEYSTWRTAALAALASKNALPPLLPSNLHPTHLSLGMCCSRNASHGHPSGLFLLSVHGATICTIHLIFSYTYQVSGRIWTLWENIGKGTSCEWTCKNYSCSLHS